MKIDYQLTKQDYIDFNMNYMSNSKSVKRLFIAQRYIVPIIFLLMPVMLIRVTSIPLGYWFKVFLVSSVLWIIFYPKYFKWSVSKRISKMLDEGENTDMLGKRSLTLTEKGIIDCSTLSESKTDWSVIEKITQTQKHIFIFISSVAAYILPVHVFNNENEKKRFIDKLNYIIQKSKGKNNIV
ncbi:YcxB family protein [Clostridium sp. CF012]|uniref:YcxB family protein n=1 Tax=Clostridium sp. CF012 TaxID=2843319 RepID=UPI001C0CB2CC|nr:YcxB family protein [Clostridium sp. CF012]MBU3143700.1 YcxB family protein [Clostridium sp. CF012]